MKTYITTLCQDSKHKITRIYTNIRADGTENARDQGKVYI